MDTVLQLFAAIILAYGLAGLAYLCRLHREDITRKYSWLIAEFCVWLFWPLILWSEVEHTFKERQRTRGGVVPTKEYLTALADHSVERRRHAGTH